MSDNPFAHLIKAPPPPQAPQQPQTIGGTRVLGGPPPSERRAEEDQAMERARLGLSMEDQQIQRERLRLSQEQDERDRVKVESGFDATESERKAAAFLLRALGANTSYEGTGMGPRSLPQQMVRDATPNVENYFIGGGRQTADSAQDEFIAASLRQDSGAAIPEEELERQRRIYFPMPGDGPEVIEQKRQARIRAIEGLKQSSGRLLNNTLGEWQKLGVAAIKSALDSGASKDEILAIAERNGLSVDEAALDANIASRDAGGATNEVLPPEATDELRGRPGFFDVAKQGLTLGLSDEAAGVGQAIGQAILGNFDVSKNYTEGRDAERARIEQARENIGPFTSGVTELLGAGGAVRAAPNALIGIGRSIRAAGQPVTRNALQTGLTKQAAEGGAAVGATGGYGYGEGLEQSGAGAVGGAIAGAAVGAAGQAIGNRLANRGGTPPTGGGAATQQAADDLGIELIPAVTGGTTTRRLTSGARQGFISDRPIARNVERMEQQGGAARDKIASNAGQVLDAQDAGDVVRQAANVYSGRTSQIGGNLYTRADRMAKGEKLPLSGAVQAADDELAQLAKGPGGADSALYKDIAKLRKQMAGGRFEVDGIRAFRSRLRNELTERGLRGTPQDAAFSRILRAAEEDMVSGLQASGKDNAARALRTAADFWRKRVETIDEVLEPVLGKNSPKSGEQIITALERLANPKTGDANRLRRLFDAMPKDEAASVRATLINRMGRPTAGASQNADEAGFSFNTFLTNWNNMSPRAKATMFPKESRESLDKLVTVSKAVKEAGSSLNTSNTAGALTVQGILTTGLWYLEPITAVAGAGGQYAIGKLLASPKFARILAGAPKAATPQARKVISARLSGLAKAEPMLAREIGLYQKAINDNVGIAAAAEDPNQ